MGRDQRGAAGAGRRLRARRPGRAGHRLRVLGGGAIGAALQTPRGRRLAVSAFVLVLLVATAAAFGNAERLKLERSPLTAPRLDRIVGPTCACPRDTARLGIRLRRGDRIDVSIVDATGDEVRRLATGVRRPAGRVSFAWDGRDDSGDVVPNGRYRLRIDLQEARRTITVPTTIRVDSTPPRLRLFSAQPPVISPDGDGRADRVLYTYRVSERALPLVVVDGEEVVRGRVHAARRERIRWRGGVGGAPVEPGTYDTWLVAEDEAGNRSRPSRTVPVRVRYVDVAGVPRHVRRGARFRFSVDADSKTVAVRIRSAAGRVAVAARRAPGVVAVRAPREPGPYVLVVRSAAHSDRARLRVTRR